MKKNDAYCKKTLQEFITCSIENDYNPEGPEWIADPTCPDDFPGLENCLTFEVK